MELGLTSGDIAFRDAVRAYFATKYPQAILTKTRAGRPLTREDYIASQRALQARGWYAVHWPAEHGGPGWSPLQRHIFDEELERSGAPGVIPMGVLYVGPVLYTFGSEAQQRRWLPGILDSTNFWAQGYSEPEAGSDLTALRLAAVRDGNDYVLNGEKIWTSEAHWADWIFCLVRTGTGARKEEGISFLCLEMTSAGVTVHPILSMDGSHHLNRVTFEDVRVPVDNRIGAEGEGWRYARFLLANERVSYAHVGRKRVEIERLRAAAATRIARGEIDAGYMTRLARVEIDVLALEMMVLRALDDEERATPDRSASMKIFATETAQAITELQVELAGPAAYAAPEPRASAHGALPDPAVASFPAQAMAGYLFERAQTIYGGSTEIQKDIMARALLRRG